MVLFSDLYYGLDRCVFIKYHMYHMTSVSISQIKVNPSKAIAQAEEFPVAVESHNKIKAYLLGKDLYEKIIAYVENFIDKTTVDKTDFKKGKDFETVAADLGI